MEIQSKIRYIPKYRDLSPEDYEKRIKNSETIALQFLNIFLFYIASSRFSNSSKQTNLQGTKGFVDFV